MTHRYTKKPVEVEAGFFRRGQQNGESMAGWIKSLGGNAQWFAHKSAVKIDGKVVSPADPEHIAIVTLEGTMRASVGDYIIRGVQGEFYPCKPDIFIATYDRVVEEDDGHNWIYPIVCPVGPHIWGTKDGTLRGQTLNCVDHQVAE